MEKEKVFVFIVAAWDAAGNDSEFPLVVVSGAKTSEEAVDVAVQAGRIPDYQRSSVRATRIEVIVKK